MAPGDDDVEKAPLGDVRPRPPAPPVPPMTPLRANLSRRCAGSSRLTVFARRAETSGRMTARVGGALCTFQPRFYTTGLRLPAPVKTATV